MDGGYGTAPTARPPRKWSVALID